MSKTTLSRLPFRSPYQRLIALWVLRKFDFASAREAFLRGNSYADETIDKLRARYGRKVVYFGSVQDSRDTAPMRISFTHIPDLELEQD